MAPTKRKAISDVEIAASRKRRTNPHRAAKVKYASTAERNQAESPFLRLPREIRDRIYDLALGGHFVHVMPTHEPYTKRDNSYLYPKEKRSYMEFPKDNQTLNQMRAKALEVRRKHRTGRCGLIFEACRETEADLDYSCDSPVHEFHVKGEARGRCIREAQTEACWKAARRRRRYMSERDDRRPFSQEVPFHFLQVCKQIYEEAKFVPYTANTFEFSGAFSFITFCLADLQPEAMAALKNVVIRATIRPERDFSLYKQWPEVLIPAFLQHLTGLRQLHVVLHYDGAFLYMKPGFSDRWNKVENFGIKDLRSLPSLRKVEVEVQIDRHYLVDRGEAHMPNNDTIKQFAQSVESYLMQKGQEAGSGSA